MQSTALSFLDLNRWEENRLIEVTFDYWLFDALYFEFMYATGAAEVENPEHGPWANMVLAVLFGSFIINSLVYLNTLIAIVGEVWTEAREQQPRIDR